MNEHKENRNEWYCFFSFLKSMLWKDLKCVLVIVVVVRCRCPSSVVRTY